MGWVSPLVLAADSSLLVSGVFARWTGGRCSLCRSRSSCVAPLVPLPTVHLNRSPSSPNLHLSPLCVTLGAHAQEGYCTVCVCVCYNSSVNIVRFYIPSKVRTDFV